MKKYIITKNHIEGFHRYPEAKNDIEFLSSPHRHIFFIDCCFQIQHNNREIEIFQQQKIIENTLYKKFGAPCQFDTMSCEDICEFLMNSFDNLSQVIVKEDNQGGACIQR